MTTDLGAARLLRAREADDRLRELLADALRTTGAPDQGLALVAIGGYGRSELSPSSDLDVVLLHDPGLDHELVGQVAEAVWYPLWDAGVALDHSVRDTIGMRETAASDDRAAMGMLDARPVAGDSALVLTLRSEVLADWRRDARRRLEEVRATRAIRIERAGSLANAAVPDLKESAGGLRDGVVLRALVATWLIDVPHSEAERLRHGILDVRDALHQVTGRRSEKLDPELVPEVAAVLDLAPVELDLHVRGLGRRVEHLSTLAWRRVEEALAPDHRRRITATGPQVVGLADGVGRLDGEVIITRDADPGTDPELALRAAAAAVREQLPLSAGSAARLDRTLGDLPDPWPASTTRLLVDLLTAGAGLVPVWDELDFAGVVDRILPEWAPIRLRGSSSPVHRFTVDRHSLETVVNAAATARDVSRPDLLAVAALLHDIGKGLPGDHSTVGEPVAVEVARRWGFAPADAALIGTLVRHHLLLPDTATRRDIEDPATAEGIAEMVGDEETLDLLAALTAADAQATSPQAWSAWRRGLVEGLVAKTRAVLAGRAPDADVEYDGWPMHVAIPDVGATGPGDVDLTVEPHRDGSLLTIVSSSRPGVMAELAGGMALAGLGIRSARTVSLGDAAASLWEVSRPDVDPSVLAPRLRSALSGEIDLATRLVLPPHDDVPLVRLLASRTPTATVLEVRARDRRGLLWSVCRTIAEAGLSIRSAHLSTYGAEARDVFYVLDGAGGRLDESTADDLVRAVTTVLS